MGNDGGSIPDRRDLVRTKAKAEQADKANQTRARWFFCALSKKPLQEPIVSCALGKLYNKDAILEYLLDKSVYGDGERICGHIRSLKDVKTLILTPNSTPSNNNDSTEKARFICPFSMKEMNGAQPFVFIWTCGCVFSQAGLKTMSSASTTPPKEEDKDASPQVDLCPQCSAKYNKADDIIMLNSSPEEEEKLRAIMERRRLAEPTKPKKSKKRKNADEETEPASKKSKTASTLPSTNPNIAAASRAVISSLAMEEAKRKANMSEAVKSLYGDGKEKKETFTTRGTFTRLHLSSNFLNGTYTDDAGKVIYKVNTPTRVGGSTTIAKVLPADVDIPRRESDVVGGERFASLGRINWKFWSTTRASTIQILGQEIETKDFFRSEGWAGKLLGSNRVFTAPDGKEYKWFLGPYSSKLVLNDKEETPVAKYHRGNLGITEEKRRAVLEVFPAGEHMADLIIITFLYTERLRREG
ncbi:Replication termination factor 2 [Paramarasmius palmivorus]|uniref:Replication termination factor 2 n=1 Tax=Paramarasmius palmivorus TaxID=297713 RepID=A0AAW0CQV4_9AGAR